MPSRVSRIYDQRNIVPNIERDENETVQPPRMREAFAGALPRERTDRLSPARTLEDGTETGAWGLFAAPVGDVFPPRSRATRLENEHRQWQQDMQRFRNERREQTASASLNRLAGGLESEARYRRIEMNDEAGARIAERRASDIRRGML